MSVGDVIGKVQVALGDVKIVAADGVVRDAAYDALVYEGERVLSNDSNALFQIQYFALPESTVYSGVFEVLVGDSVVAGADESENILGAGVDIFETAGKEEGVSEEAEDVADTEAGDDIFETEAGEEGLEGNSRNIEENPLANDYPQTFGRGDSDAVGFDDTPSLDENEFGDNVNDEPTIVINPGTIEGENDSVNESGLSTGSDSSADTEFAYGTFTISDPDGLGDIESVTINGIVIPIADLEGSSVSSGIGTLTITGYNSATGEGVYQYELTSSTIDVDGVIETDLFTLTVSDGVVDSAPAVITVEINDDVPSIANTQDAILTNEDGNILSGADLGIDFGADGASPIAAIVLTPEVDNDGFAIDANGKFLTSTVGENTYNLVYVQNSDGSVTAWQDTPDGDEVFTLIPDISTGTYSVEIQGQLDGAFKPFEVDFASGGHDDAGHGDILVYTVEHSALDALYVVATADGNPHDKVNYNSQIGIGASNQFIEYIDKNDEAEALTLRFTNSSVATTSIAEAIADAEGDPAYFTNATFEIGKFDSGDIITWKAYNGTTLVGEGTGDTGTVEVSVTDSGDTFNSVVFEGTPEGGSYAILSMGIWSGGEDDPGMTHTINVDITATDADGDVVTADGELQVTFDNDGEITVDNADFDEMIDGGDGIDTLIVSDGTLNLSNVSDIEVVQLGTDATVEGSDPSAGITASDVISATSTSNTLLIESIDDATTNVINIDTNSLALLSDGDDGYNPEFNTYTDGIATILIDINEPITVD